MTRLARAGLLTGVVDDLFSSVALGILMHSGVALAWSAAFLFVLFRAWMVLSLVVIPIFTHRPPTIGVRWWIQWFGHIPFVGVPIAASSRTESLRAG
jgi:hypothetical protein